MHVYLYCSLWRDEVRTVSSNGGSAGRTGVTHILLVDDDAVISKVFAVMLKRADFEVEIAEDGVKGVEMWERGNYGLVLMDVQMPRMNGFEATRAIREKE